MKIQIVGIVHWHKYSWSDKATYEICQHDMSEQGPEWVPIGPAEFEFEIPEGFDPVDGQIKSLRAAKEKLLAETHVKVLNIEEQIQKLLCLENKADV